VCGHTVDCSSDVVSSGHHKSGVITSPGYGTSVGYPAGVFCRYRFYAGDGERVRVVFADFDLRYQDGDASRPDE